MKFGNWNVSAERIEWAGEEAAYIHIDRGQLLETEAVADRKEPLYKNILRATIQQALNEDDLYDLNFAFAYAAGAWQQDINYEIFDKTVAYQFEILEEDDEEDEDEDDEY